MYFKVSKDTELFEKLTAINKQMQKANAAANKIAKEVGAEGVASSSHGIAGGIRGFAFKNYMEKKEGWNKLEKGASRWFFPKAKDKSNKDLLERIAKLPVVSEKELGELLKYESQLLPGCGGGLRFSRIPGIYWRKTCVLIELDPEAKYTPLDGMVEILASEFKELKEDEIYKRTRKKVDND